MEQLNNHREKLIAAFSIEYIDKLFYFCLKKTGNPTEAEELASDISVNIISGLRKGIIPTHFSAWVWKIARNRYSVWAEKKQRAIQLVSGIHIEELQVISDKFIEEEYMHSEDLKLLRRELAFIFKDYREIIVAFYIEDRKVQDIALSLGLPEGTVKTKLFRSRKILKEGMNMAREFGIRSYKPENVNFAASGSQPSGLPWGAVQRQIPKNILLQAHNNPSTMEELAIELGIAAPYMEEEVNILVQATLIKKMDNDRYVTNFFIADKECQMAIYQALRMYSKERSKIIDTLIDESLPGIKKLKLMRNEMSDRDFKWFLVIHFANYIIENIKGYNVRNPVKRNDGGHWGFIGFEQNDISEKITMGHNGSGSNSIVQFWAYKIGDYNLWHRAGEMNYNQALLLGDIIKNKRNISSLTDSEKDIWKGIDLRFAHTDEQGNIVPDIVVFENNAQKELYNIFKQHELYPLLLEKYQKCFDDIISILKKNSTPVLYEHLNYCASMFIFNTRMMVVHDEVEAGKLLVPEDPERSTIAMYLEIK